MEVTVLMGLLVSHWFSLVFYYPERIAQNPWVLLWIPAGLSSVGGFVGGLLAMWWATRRKGLPLWRYIDLAVCAGLLGFTIGRLGCALVHDHPGRVVEAGTWLAVGPWPDGLYRYDLGLIELGLCVGLCVVMLLIFDWRRAPAGRFAAVTLGLYRGVRFFLDFFRAELPTDGGAPDPRYLGLTAAQYIAMLFVLGSLILLVHLRRPTAVAR